MMAIVLSILLIIIFYGLQTFIFPKNDSENTTNNQNNQNVQSENDVDDNFIEDSESSDIGFYDVEPVESTDDDFLNYTEVQKVIKTNIFEVTFSTKGANLRSIKLLNFNEADGSPVEMILSKETGMYPFDMIIDDYNTQEDIFSYEIKNKTNIIFSRDYLFNKDGKKIPFTLKKSFVILENEYLLEMKVSFEVADELVDEIPFNHYYFEYGPQIGPKYRKLDNNDEYRHLIYYSDGKRKDYTGKVKNTKKPIEDRALWAGIEGKYFLMLGISYISKLNEIEIGFNTNKLYEGFDRSGLYFKRFTNNESKLNDTFKFFIGPKKKEILARYNEKDKNAFGESGWHLEAAVKGDFWGWLSDILKYILVFIFGFTKNWGVAIIIMSIFIKVVFFPLTFKSFESTNKMQALGPKMEELKTKYKKEPQKLNQEMAALYKKEGVNPLGGCLPLLLQLPILMALFSLFRTYFEFRGAAFIVPWIMDLSAPEKILTMPFEIPFLGVAGSGVTALRILPFIMLLTTFLYQKFSHLVVAINKQRCLCIYYLLFSLFLCITQRRVYFYIGQCRIYYHFFNSYILKSEKVRVRIEEIKNDI